jgi:intraflagellar transport protein 172
LIETNQEEKAAEIKEEEGDYNTAINLYLKGGIPAKAANVVYNSNVSFPQELLEKIASALASAGMHEKAGELYEEMDLLQKALDCYVKGNAYKKAVDLAKSA